MKQIKDTVHGYIDIPRVYFENLIDNHIFQRLKRIEQTSIRSVFPCAKHDRFIHSIGVYHLGRKAFQTIIDKSSIEFDPNEIKILRQSFEIACLLHDCGHSPFSHLFERHYETSNKLKELIVNSANDKNISDDFRPAKAHEKVSAYLVLTYFKDPIHNINPQIDTDLIARMIIGCTYEDDSTQINQLKNCFITLLNGNAIDVDKLDYSARDRWASGYFASTVDLDRLIASFRIEEYDGKLVFCINKSAISEIEGVIDSRNFQHTWVINHHKAVYDELILNEALKKAAKNLNGGSEDKVIQQVFNIDTILSPQKVCGVSVFQLTDDDIISLLKNDIENNEFAQEWLYRIHTYKPLWKTYSEFRSLISSKCKGSLVNNVRLLEDTTEKVLKEIFPRGGYLYKKIDTDVKRVEENELMIIINSNDGPICYLQLDLPNKYQARTKPYVYIYVKEPLLKQKDDVIKKMISNLK